MTKSNRRKADASGSAHKTATEPGVKYTCDSCLVDITHTVRIQCAHLECEEVDLCPNCFSEGKEVQSHKAWHDYKVVETHSVPIFTEDWGADEELLLITGLELFGIGNWQEVAEHVGTRFKDECEKHYLETYLGEKGGVRRQMPRMTAKVNIGREEFQSRKKRRIEDMRKPHALPAHATEQAKGSAPNNHEVAGYMPARLEFEHEVDNEAEMVIKDMEFGLVMGYGGADQPEAPPKTEVPTDKAERRPPPAVSSKAPSAVPQGPKSGEDGDDAGTPKVVDVDGQDADGDIVMTEGDKTKEESPEPEVEAEKADEGEVVIAPPMDVEDPEDIELKLALLDIYYSKLDHRTEIKDLIFDRNLMSYKLNRSTENKRPKEDKEILQRYKVFAKLQTPQDFEILVDGLSYEQNLRKQIGILQDYRRSGITTVADAIRFEREKNYRTTGYRNTEKPSAKEFMSATDRSLARGTASEHAAAMKANAAAGASIYVASVPPPALVYAESFSLLSQEEQQLCSEIKILPKPFLMAKETMIRENARRGGLFSRSEAVKLFHVEEHKSKRIYDFLSSKGILFHPSLVHAAETPSQPPPSSPDMPLNY